MPILGQQPEPEPVVVTQQTVDAVMTEAREHCAPTTWDRYVRSLAANGYRFDVK